MDCRRKIRVIIVTIWPALFLILSPPATAHGISPEIKNLLVKPCAGSTNPNVCLTTLSVKPNISYVTDIPAVMNIALAAVRDESRAVLDVLQKTLKPNPKAGEAYKWCMKYVSDTIWQLNTSNGALTEGFATLDVHYAYDSITYCETVMSDDKINVPAVANKIKQWKDAFYIAYSVVSVAENEAIKD